MMRPPSPAAIMSLAAACAAKNAPFEVDPEDEVEMLFTDVDEGLADLDAGAVHEDVEAAEGGLRVAQSPSALAATPTFAPSATDFLPSFSISADTARALTPPRW